MMDSLSRVVGPTLRRLLDAPFQVPEPKRTEVIRLARDAYEPSYSGDEQVVIQDGGLVEETETGYWLDAVVYLPKEESE